MDRKNTSAAELLVNLAMFLVYTICVMALDVQPIGPQGTKVGMATVNGAFFTAFGQNPFWYALTEILGIVAILLGGFYALLFLLQWYKRKGIYKVDRHLWSFALLMVYVILAYAFFELFVVNVRPVMGEEGLEASYPSSHTMLVVAVLSFSFSRIRYYVKNSRLLITCRIAFLILMLLVVVGRLFSGVHWLTDILGSLLLTNFLYSLNEFSLPLLDRVCE